MEIRINKNLLLPIAMIIVAVFVGGVLLLLDKPKQKPVAPSAQNAQQTEKIGGKPQISANARTLELSVPGMFCAGCKASVEGYLSSVTGIEFVEARLTPRKSATVIYNPDKINKNQIIKNQIFDTYGPATIISDEPFRASTTQLNQSTTLLPSLIQQKTNKVSQLLIQKQKEGIDTSGIQRQLDDINQLLQKEQYQQAESLLDTVISQLEKL